MQVHRLSLGQVSAYLVESAQGVVLVDAGMPGQEQKVVQKLRELGRPELRLIYITHAHLDHYGSAAALKSFTNAPVAIHQFDSDTMRRGQTLLGDVRGRGKMVKWLFPLIAAFFHPAPLNADIHLNDGDRLDDFGLAGCIVHTPGHTAGSSCLWLEEGVLFAGDLVSSNGKPHIQRFFAQHWSSIFDSLRRSQALKPRLVYPGHGARPLSGDEFQALHPEKGKYD